MAIIFLGNSKGNLRFFGNSLFLLLFGFYFILIITNEKILIILSFDYGKLAGFYNCWRFF